MDFQDGTVWDLQFILSNLVVPITEGADTLYGTIVDDTIAAQGGDDLVLGLEGQDSLDGGAGNDSVVGGNGDDVLRGGVGNDALNGGSGNDIYVFSQGFGQDTIENFDDAAGRVDKIVFESGIRSEEHTSELKSLMRISYAVFCLKKKKTEHK